MTTAERITALLDHGIADQYLIAALLNLDVADVAHAMSDPTYEPTSVISGALVRHKFPFSYNTPGLEAGLPIYTPTVDEVLYEAWFEVTTPWNGTTPQADVGFLQGDIWGWFGDIVNSIDLTIADHTDGAGFLSSGMICDSRGNPPYPNSVAPSSLSRALLRAYGHVNANGAESPFDSPVPRTQARFQTAEPIKLVVSQTGGTTTGGPDYNPAVAPGATQGEAAFYFVTVLP